MRHCLGARLARFEATTALTHLLDRYPTSPSPCRRRRCAGATAYSSGACSRSQSTAEYCNQPTDFRRGNSRHPRG
ncbi:hypothetical protein [Nocardia sp. XZ_19_385]|uniref:hypothetical protein n=1 Tax=Nocardia sp. XZ_19_385 TaxID=2769488 RepID=UPI002814F91F|nr:hypothetical protein [Nocardia sp. XZ_19_385]